jgi:hypothetical protein
MLEILFAVSQAISEAPEVNKAWNCPLEILSSLDGSMLLVGHDNNESISIRPSRMSPLAAMGRWWWTAGDRRFLRFCLLRPQPRVALLSVPEVARLKANAYQGTEQTDQLPILVIST